MYRATLQEALPRVREAIARAAQRAGREPEAVRVVAVTKAHPLAALAAALEAGLSDLGENRVEELEWKRAQMPDAAARWHMVGHVQSRKAARVTAVADIVHSVDSVKLARRLSAAAAETGRTLDVLLQVNTSGEASKSGLDPEKALEAVQQVLELGGLRVEGLMTMAPFTDNEGRLRDAFRGLRETLEAARKLSENVGSELSMGMTNDFGIAIEEGSTMVRLGTALFGKRPK
jgi:pyridoxal phosphate enzyme (YggS family)